MQSQVKKPETNVLEKVNTVGELIEQLKRFDPQTAFPLHQAIMHIKSEDRECIVFVQTIEEL